MAIRRLWILGDSGLSREVELIAHSVDPGQERWSEVERIPESAETDLHRLGGDAVMGVGSPNVRTAIATRFAEDQTVYWPVLVHPRADIGSRVELASGVVVASGVIVTVDVSIKEWTMLNYNVTVGHDAAIGRCCLINPQAAISGYVTIGDRVLIGAGAVVLEGRHVGDGAIVGAGAVVATDVDANTTVVGVPAKARRAEDVSL